MKLPDVGRIRQGAPVEMRAQPGGLLLVFFGYTSCPDVCPTTMSALRATLKEIGPLAERVEVVMVTVDPARDTPEALAAYLEHFFERYRALRTEDQQALDFAKRAFGVKAEFEGDPSSGNYAIAHTANVFAVDDRGMLVAEWPHGIRSSLIARDIGLLLQRYEFDSSRSESSENKDKKGGIQ